MEMIQDYSLHSRVFEQLRDDIVSGKYKENDELREITLGKELGVSRTPVREALRQLELVGLVRIIPNKGAYVTGISTKDVTDIYQIRSLLEGLCARLATENITEEQLEQLEEIIMLSKFYLDKSNASSGEDVSQMFSKLDSQFHNILYDASKSRMLEHVLAEFHKYVQISRTMSVKKKNRAKCSIAEHEAILNAMKNKDADLAEKLANQHILNAEKAISLLT